MKQPDGQPSSNLVTIIKPVLTIVEEQNVDKKKIASLIIENEILREFVERVAGPVGSGCELGGFQHMAQKYRDAADSVKVGGIDERSSTVD